MKETLLWNLWYKTKLSHNCTLEDLCPLDWEDWQGTDIVEWDGFFWSSSNSPYHHLCHQWLSFNHCILSLATISFSTLNYVKSARNDATMMMERLCTCSLSLPLVDFPVSVVEWWGKKRGLSEKPDNCILSDSVCWKIAERRNKGRKCRERARLTC